MGKKTVGMRIVVFVVTIVMMFTTLCAIWIDAIRQKDARLDLVSTGYADSNARRAALIDFAKKKNFGDIGADTIAELTDEDIQLIGVFLSNFYIPWSTSVGVTREENQEEMTKKMVDALVNQCNFDKEVATALVPMIFAMSETSSKPLKVASVKKVGDTSEDWELEDKSIYFKDDDKKESRTPNQNVATVLNFFAIAAGDFASDLGNAINGSSDWNGKEDGFISGTEPFAADKKWAMYWEDGSTKHVVWSNDCGDKDKKNALFSASAVAYGIVCDKLNYNAGLGGNALLNTDDYEYYKKLSAEAKDLVFAANCPLYVDCFGNIIADLGTDHVVILPGCVNPFTWTDVEGKNAGKSVNLVNLFMLGEISEDHISRASDTDYSYGFYNGSQSLFNIYHWRDYRGSTNIEIDKTIFDDEETKKLKALTWPNDSRSDTYFPAVAAPGSDGDKPWFPNWRNYADNLTNGSGSVSNASEGYFERPSDLNNIKAVKDAKIENPTYSAFSDPKVTGTDSLEKDTFHYTGASDTLTISRKGWKTFVFNGNTYQTYKDHYLFYYYVISNSSSDYKGWFLFNDVLYGGFGISYKESDWLPILEEFEKFVDKGENLSTADVTGYSFIKNGGLATDLYKTAYQDMLMIDNFNLSNFQNSESDFEIEKGDTDSGSDYTESEDVKLIKNGEISSEVFKKMSVDVFFHDWYIAPEQIQADPNYDPKDSVRSMDNIIKGRNAQWDGTLKKQLLNLGKLSSNGLTAIPLWLHNNLGFRYVTPDEAYTIWYFLQDGGSPATTTTSLVMSGTISKSLTENFSAYPLTAFADDSSSDSSSTDSTDKDKDEKDKKSKNKSGDIIKVIGLWSEDGKSLVKEVGSKVGSFSNVTATNQTTTLSGSAAKPYIVSIYLSYVYAFYDDNGSKLEWRFNKAGIPTSEGCVDWSDVEFDNSDAMLTETMSLVYYIMHPSKGVAIVKAWFKNKIGGILVDWHEDMAGNASATSTSGTTRYIGFSGYVTVPGLKDLSWTNWLLVKYDSLIIYFIIIMIVIMIGYAMIGSLTFQRAVLGVLLFAFCAYLPPRAINATVDFSNRMCDQIYGSKFTYWALVQHQQYFTQLNAAANAETEDQYLQKLFVAQAQDNTAEYANVTVKWMCPKKDNYMARIQEQIEEETNSNGNITRLIGALLTEQVGGENYIDQANALYLYRSYTDIAEYSKYGYEGTKEVKEYDITKSLGMSTGVLRNGINWSTFIDDYSVGMKSKSNYFEMIDFKEAMKLGFNYPTAKDVSNYSTKSAEDTGWRYKFVSYSVGSYNAIKNGLKYAKMKNVLNYNNIGTGKGGSTAGIPQQDMDFGLSALNGLRSNGALTDSLKYHMKKSQVGDFITACYNESPYYFFSYNLYDQLASQASQAGGNAAAYKDLFLASDESSYFYNMSKELQGTPGYGELRDYMDMRSLFTVIIPYLKAANDVVVEWDNTEGLYLYDDVQVEFDSDGVVTIPDEVIKAGTDSEIAYKFWHNVNVVQLFNMYTPWVDTMYDCNYAKGQNITVAGKKFYVEDPLDPVSYIGSGRPMIFSESEMMYWGLTKADLTTVELKILEVNENCYENMLMLMDYYTFDNDVINTAGAMLQTFEFNKVFSQTDIFSTDYILYPQAYELKNFSYDAYLRLILSASTGEEINADYSQTGGAGGTQGDFYSNMVQKSSILTGIMLVFVDLFACYAIPALKLFFIVALFFLSIIMILAASIKLEMRLSKVLLDSLVLPLLKFLAVSVGMAFFVSMFMYNGNTAVTGRNSTTITLGDPVMVLLVMLLINAGVLVLYFRICKKVFQDAVKYTKTVATSITGMVGGLGSGIVNGVKSGMNRTGLATAAAGAGLAYGLGRGIGKVRDRVRGGSNGTGSAGGDPKARGAANTDVQPKSKPSTSKSDNFKGLNKYDKKLAKGETKVETNKMHADIAEERAKGHRDLVDKDARGVKKLGSKYHEMRAGRYDKKAGKFTGKAKTASDRLESNRANLESRSALAKKRTAARQKTKFGGSAYKKATKSQIKSNAKQKREKK